MKPSVLATGDRLSADWTARRTLRFPVGVSVREDVSVSLPYALAAAWLLILIVPILVGGAIMTTLDEPLLAVVAATLAMIPLLIGLCPRQRG